jgi:hypothetical protein
MSFLNFVNPYFCFVLFVLANPNWYTGVNSGRGASQLELRRHAISIPYLKAKTLVAEAVACWRHGALRSRRVRDLYKYDVSCE